MSALRKAESSCSFRARRRTMRSTSKICSGCRTRARVYCPHAPGFITGQRRSTIWSSTCVFEFSISSIFRIRKSHNGQEKKRTMDSGRSTIRIFLLILVLAATGFTQERFVKPIDEANLEPSFLAFRTKLIAAAERQDAKYILSIVDPNISNGFGGRDGIANFKKDWKIESKNSEFWAEFLPVIKNGGHFIGEGRNRLSLFAAPYTFNGFPDDLDEIPNFA